MLRAESLKRTLMRRSGLTTAKQPFLDGITVGSATREAGCSASDKDQRITGACLRCWPSWA